MQMRHFEKKLLEGKFGFVEEIIQSEFKYLKK